MTASAASWTIWPISASPPSSSCRWPTSRAAGDWGYDGVLPYTPDDAYGSPDDLKRLIDEAHGRNLMVFLDVVYNHFGPEGNYLSTYAKSFFTERHHTPWGAAINFDGKDARPVRDYFINNALYWLTSTASTACASMPCMRSSTTASPTS